MKRNPTFDPRYAFLSFALVFAVAPLHAAEMKPVVVNPSFAEPEAEKPAKNAPTPAPKAADVPISCRLAITSIADERAYPDYMGNFFDQPFHPPVDRMAWIKSMVNGLEKRGVSVKFLSAGEGAPAGHTPVSLALKTAWLDYHNGGFNGLVRIGVSSRDPARPLNITARGNYWRTLFMATVGGRANDALNGAVANALSDLAEKVRPICQ